MTPAPAARQAPAQVAPRPPGPPDALAADLVRQSVLGDLARRVVADCGADVGMVGIPDQADRIVLRHWAGTRADLLHNLVVPAGTGLGGKALAQRRPSWVSDYRASTTISHHHDAAVDADGLYAMLTVPLMHGETVLGVVYASLRTVVPFGDLRIVSVVNLAVTAARALSASAAWADYSAADDEPTGRAQVPWQKYALTPRERQVLNWVATGRTNPEIAAELGLTCNTVTGYLKSAMHKLGARNRVELTVTAGRVGLLD